MRINWKVLIAVALIAAAAAWAFTSLRTQTYTGTPLAFDLGRGLVTVTNPSDSAVSAQLVGTGSRSFTVDSATEGMVGTSIREGSGRSTTQTFTMMVPAGSSTFTVSRGTNVRFLSETDSPLSASVQPMTAGETQTTLIATAIVILGALIYLWRALGHRLTSAARQQRAADQLAWQNAMNTDPAYGQGSTIRSYGDNRAEIKG